MEKNILCFSCIALIVCGFYPSLSSAYYGRELCKYPEFHCIKVKNSDSWEKRWPNARERDMVMRLNRTNLDMTDRSWVVVPNHLSSIDILDISPFPTTLDTHGKKLVLVDMSKLAFGAYDEHGQLLRWGPVSGGKSFCPDIGTSCTTPPGEYAVYEKRGEDCFSKTFPVDTRGGAPMPYCMFFHEGYALHGSPAVPGYNASHGCVRLFTEDAKWLNEEFTQDGTKVTVINDE